MDKVLRLMPIIIKDVPATAKIAWRDLTFFADKFEFNGRKAEAWLRVSKAKAKTKLSSNPYTAARQSMAYNSDKYGGFMDEAAGQLITKPKYEATIFMK